MIFRTLQLLVTLLWILVPHMGVLYVRLWTVFWPLWTRTIYTRTQYVKFHMISRSRLQYIVETHETTNMRSIVKWSLSESDVRSQQLKGNIKYMWGRRFYEKDCFMGFNSTLITANIYKTWFNFCADRARKSYANSQIESLYKLSLDSKEMVWILMSDHDMFFIFLADQPSVPCKDNLCKDPIC